MQFFPHRHKTHIEEFVGFLKFYFLLQALCILITPSKLYAIFCPNLNRSANCFGQKLMLFGVKSEVNRNADIQLYLSIHIKTSKAILSPICYLRTIFKYWHIARLESYVINIYVRNVYHMFQFHSHLLLNAGRCFHNMETFFLL